MTFTMLKRKFFSVGRNVLQGNRFGIQCEKKSFQKRFAYVLKCAIFSLSKITNCKNKEKGEKGKHGTKITFEPDE